MLKYFREGLKPSILAELEHQDLELQSFNQIVKKAVDAETKSALCLRSSTKEMDQHCPRGNQPANSTKSQGSTMKDPRSEEPKVRGTESSGLQRSESSKKARKEKKKEQRRKNRERQEGSIPAADGEAEPHQKKKKNQGHSDRVSRDTSQIKCYNYQKIGHYANKCPEPKN